jgi:hypothetical protein
MKHILAAALARIAPAAAATQVTARGSDARKALETMLADAPFKITYLPIRSDLNGKDWLAKSFSFDWKRALAGWLDARARLQGQHGEEVRPDVPGTQHPRRRRDGHDAERLGSALHQHLHLRS